MAGPLSGNLDEVEAIQLTEVNHSFYDAYSLTRGKWTLNIFGIVTFKMEHLDTAGKIPKHQTDQIKICFGNWFDLEFDRD